MLVDYFRNIQFAQPYLLLLLALIPVLIIWYVRGRNKRTASVIISTTAAPGIASWKTSIRHLPFICRLLTLAFIIVALAKPQTRNENQTKDGEGIDIVLAIDVSGSMTAQDLTPNRLEAAKNVAANFVSNRSTDRIGLVIFSGESFTQCPLTTDHAVVLAAIKNIRSGLLQDGTAIGAGLGTAVDRVRSGTSKSKIVVLLTDGENNSGLIDPKTAKEIAKSFNIKVYTIGVGTDRTAPQPIQTPMGVVIQRQRVSIDENLLKEIAAETGGQYFRAKDNESLSGIYNTIDQLEKSKMEITTNISYKDKFMPFLIGAIFFLMIEVLLRYIFLRKFP